ncbi:hypothetical protein FHG87_011326 [Trinorchestia longiramus]|nr:hypothetical protein FHG87_011326 [Trinorchestia longiramus]
MQQNKSILVSSRHVYNEELLRQLQSCSKTITRLKNVIEDANVQCVQVTEELHKLAVDSSSQLSHDEQQACCDSPKLDQNTAGNHDEEQIPSAELPPNAASDQPEFHSTKSEQVVNLDCKSPDCPGNLDDSAFDSFLAMEEKVSSLKSRLVELEEMKLRCEGEWSHKRETVATDLRVMRSLVCALRPAHQETTPSKSSLLQLLDDCDSQLEELRSQHSALDAFFSGLDRRLITDETSGISSPDDSQSGTDVRGWGHLELQQETPALSPTETCGKENASRDSANSYEIASDANDTSQEFTLTDNNICEEEAVNQTQPKEKDGDRTVVVQKPSVRMRRLVAVMSGAATTVNGLLAIMSGAAVTFHGLVGATTSSVGTVTGAVGVANGALVTLNGLAGAVGGAAATLTGRVGLIRGAAGTINSLAGTVVGTAGMISGAVGAATSTAGSFGAMVNIIRGSAGTLGGVVGVVRGTASSISAAFTDPS